MTGPQTPLRDEMGFPINAPVLGGSLHRLTPEVQRDEHGSYLPGDRSVAMAHAIAADIRRRALTEPGYLDQWKDCAASAPHQPAQKTSSDGPERAEHVLPAAEQGRRRSVRLAQPARGPAPATSARSRQAAFRARQASAQRILGASSPDRPGLGSLSISFGVVMAALYGQQALATKGTPAICLEALLQRGFQ